MLLQGASRGPHKQEFVRFNLQVHQLESSSYLTNNGALPKRNNPPFDNPGHTRLSTESSHGGSDRRPR